MFPLLSEEGCPGAEVIGSRGGGQLVSEDCYIFYFFAAKQKLMKHKIESTWQGKKKFDAVVNGHHVIMDLPEEVRR